VGLSSTPNSVGSAFDGVEIRLLLAGVKPNADAIRIAASACPHKADIDQHGSQVSFGPISDIDDGWRLSQPGS
jgi:hypothetical protein